MPGLLALDVPAPQMVDQPLVLLAAFDVLVPEQVIEVPMMLTPTRCPRTVLSMPQTAEQLVEAPNVVSLIDVIRHPVEQTVGGGTGGLPGFLPGPSYSLSAEQIVDNPVPRFRRGFGGGLHGLHPGQSSTAFGEADHRVPAATAEQIIDIPVPRGAPRDFHQNPLPAAGSSDLPDTANQQVFSTFPPSEKVRRFREPGGRNWTRTSAYGLRELCWWGCRLAPALTAARASWGTVRLLLHGPRGRRGSGECGFLLVHPLPDDPGSLGEAGTMPSSCVSLRTLWKIFLSCALAWFALGIWCIVSVVLVSGSHCSGRLGVAEDWIFREMSLSVGAMLGSTVDTCSASARWWLRRYFTHFLRCGRLES